MRTFPFDEALVAAYWRKLARSIDNAPVGKRPKLSQSAGRRGVRQRFAASKRVRSV